MADYEPKLKPRELLDALENLYAAQRKTRREHQEAQRKLIREIAQRGVADPESVNSRWLDIEQQRKQMRKLRRRLIRMIDKLDSEQKAKLARMLNKRLARRFDDMSYMGLPVSELDDANESWQAIFEEEDPSDGGGDGGAGEGGGPAAPGGGGDAERPAL